MKSLNDYKKETLLESKDINPVKLLIVLPIVDTWKSLTKDSKFISEVKSHIEDFMIEDATKNAKIEKDSDGEIEWDETIWNCPDIEELDVDYKGKKYRISLYKDNKGKSYIGAFLDEPDGGIDLSDYTSKENSLIQDSLDSTTSKNKDVKRIGKMLADLGNKCYQEIYDNLGEFIADYE